MEEWGNARGNEYYEANVPAHVHRPKEGDSVRVIEKFIREKYENKRYIAKSIPPKRETSEEVEEIEEVITRRTRPRPTTNSNTNIGADMKQNLVTGSPLTSVSNVKKAEAPSLLDFLDEPQQTVAAPTQQFDNNNEFQQFQTSATTVHQHNNDGFGSFLTASTPSFFDTPAPAVPVQQQVVYLSQS